MVSAMNDIVYSIETYNYKNAITRFVRGNIDPILKNAGFKKYSHRNYVREKNDLGQFINIYISKDNLKVWAYYMPIFVPDDNVVDFGLEVTGSMGSKLLDGKYFATFYQPEYEDPSIQLRNYHEKHLPNLDKLVSSFNEGIIPKMDVMDSVHCFFKALESDKSVFFGLEHDKCSPKGGMFYLFIIAVCYCLEEKFEHGLVKLNELQEIFEKTGVPNHESYIKLNEYMKTIRSTLIGSSYHRKKAFQNAYYMICNERRKFYKLVE